MMTMINISGITASIKREEIDDIKQNCGIDVETELARILQEEIDKDILNTIMFDNFAAGITAKNREGKIDSILYDKDFIPTNIEDTDEYKRLSEENQKKWKKDGRIL